MQANLYVIPFSIIFVAVAFIFYFKIEPAYLERVLPYLTDFPWKPFRNFTWRKFCTLNLLIVLATLIGILLTSTSLRLPTNLPNLTYDLFMARAQGDDSAHVFAYLVTPLLFFWIWYKERDALKGIAIVMFMAWFHESVWVIFFYLSYWSYLVYNLLWVRDIAFFILVIGLGYIAVKKYSFINKPLLIGMLGLLLLNIAWYLVGFPITNVANLSYAPGLATTVSGRTVWFNTLWVNMIEVGYWWYALGIFVFAEWWGTRNLSITHSHPVSWGTRT